MPTSSAAAADAPAACGTSPEKLALGIALGAICGLFPVFGTTTVLAALAAWVFRANQAVVQLVNYAVYPIYFFVEFGLVAAGAWLFEGDLHAYAPATLQALYEAGWTVMLRQGARAFAQAVAVWLVAAPIAFLALRRLSLCLIRRWTTGRSLVV